MFALIIAALLLAGGGTAYALTRNKAPKPSTSGITFSQTFASSLDTSKWIVANWKSADSKPGINLGTYVSDHMDFSTGPLRMWIDQTPDATNGMNSLGAAIQSKQKFGFGTYTFVMRQSSVSPTPDGVGDTITGGISSAFVYLPNSESEIDLEFLGDNNRMWGTNWMNPNPSQPPAGRGVMSTTEEFPSPNLATSFHTYQLVWTAKAVAWYIDGQLIACHYNNVPQAPAYIILQHRGTNSNLWGGVATPGVRRYAYFKSVTYTPQSN
jgi:beta-glucanase (GH16 family)